MNNRIGMFSSIVNLVAVAGFALSMLAGSNFCSYLFSMFIAFSFVPMIFAYAYFSREKTKLAGYTAAGFAIMYAVIASLVYFAQLTTVGTHGLTPQAIMLLDFQQFGLFFNYDMLGYAFMALGTFFAGLTIEATSKSDRWLKWLLLIHGIFFIICFIMPMLGLFSADMEGAGWVGVALLEFWCAYFIPVGILSFFHFSKESK